MCVHETTRLQHALKPDTCLRDRRLAQYAAKERREKAREESELHIGQFDHADPVETGGRFSSQVGILRGAGHGWIPHPEAWLSSQASILRGAGHGWIWGPDIERQDLGLGPMPGRKTDRPPIQRWSMGRFLTTV